MIIVVVLDVWLALFSGLPTVQFVITCSMQSDEKLDGGKAWN